MESDRFDAFVRTLGGGLSRRRIVTTVIGAGAASFIGLIAPQDTEARRKKRRRKNQGQQIVPPPPPPPPPPTIVCGTGTKLCGNACIGQTVCCGSCPAGQGCCNGVCGQLVNGFCICQSGADCPINCACALRLEDSELACAAVNLSPDECDVDADCDPGTFCRDTANGGFCSLPCKSA